MGWGLDTRWSAVAAERGWPIGVIDATPIRHLKPVAAAYPRDAAIAEAEAFLDGRGYVTPQDVKSIGPDVLRHRVLVSYEAEAEEVDADEVVRRVFDGVPVP